MAVLTIGRIGLQDVDLDHIEAWRIINDQREGRALRIEGHLKSATLAQTNYLRTSFATMEPGSLVSVTYTVDPQLDGFYWFQWADLEAKAEEVALNKGGFIKFSVVLNRIGTRSDVWFMSGLTAKVRANDYALESNHVHYLVSPPSSDPAVWWGRNSAPSSAHYRVGADGTMIVYAGTTVSRGRGDPRWDVDPADFYKNACEIVVDSYLRVGLEVPNSPTGWEINNGLMRVSPNVTNPGYFDVDVYASGSWSLSEVFRLHNDGATTISTAWDTLTVLKNLPHVVTIRLTKRLSATTGLPMFVDITLRRGARHLEFRMAQPVAADQRISFATPRGITPFTMTNASGNLAAHTSTATSNYWLMGSARALTFNTGTGELAGSVNAVGQDFYVGVSLGGAGSSAGNQKEDITRQYMASVYETVAPVLR